MSADLTQRECGIAYLTFCGWEATKVSKFYGLSSSTIKNQLTELYRKTETSNAPSLAYWWWVNVLKENKDDLSALFRSAFMTVCKEELPKDVFDLMLEKSKYKVVQYSKGDIAP